MARQREFDTAEVIGHAMRLFWQRGYEATSIRDLIDVMGISSSSMYETFGDKRGVFLAALERYCAFERAQVAAMAGATTDPAALIDQLFRGLDLSLAAADAAPEMAGSLAISTMIEFGTKDPAVTDLLFSHYTGIADIIADVITHQQSAGVIGTAHKPEHLAYAILSALYGVAAVKSVKPDFPHAAAIARIIADLLRS